MKNTNARTWVNGLTVLILFLACLFIVAHAARASGVAKSPQEDTRGLVSAGRLNTVPRGVHDLTQANRALEQVVPVMITDEGFYPEVVTVTVGTIVEWMNQTEEAVSLVGGTMYAERAITTE